MFGQNLPSAPSPLITISNKKKLASSRKNFDQSPLLPLATRKRKKVRKHPGFLLVEPVLTMIMFEPPVLRHQ